MSRFFALLGGLLLIAVAKAETTSTNLDGTGKATYTIQDEQAKNKPYDPYSRTTSDAVRDPKLISKDNAAKFPEEEKKRMLQEAERAKMTPEQKAQEKKMLDRTPDSVKNYNPTIKERQSIPNRF